MREILFRGKRLGNGEWVQGYYVNCFGPGCEPNETRYYIVEYPGALHEVYTSTVGQYTGLTDKNGKRIFEGDIVHCVSRMDAANMVVIFEDGEFRMVLCERYKNYVPGGGYYAFRCFDKNVIGNIHDNPELHVGADNG